MKATSCPLLVKTPLGGKCCALVESFLDPADQAGAMDFQRWLSVVGAYEEEVGDRTQGFRRKAA